MQHRRRRTSLPNGKTCASFCGSRATFITIDAIPRTSRCIPPIRKRKGSYVPFPPRPIENITAGWRRILHPTHEIDEDRRGAGKRTEGSIKAVSARTISRGRDPKWGTQRRPPRYCVRVSQGVPKPCRVAQDHADEPGVWSLQPADDAYAVDDLTLLQNAGLGLPSAIMRAGLVWDVLAAFVLVPEATHGAKRAARLAKANRVGRAKSIAERAGSTKQATAASCTACHMSCPFSACSPVWSSYTETCWTR